jgi:tetratricopeptide (TPR) repeat protein
LYEKAIELEPNYAQAYASLSNALTNMYWFHGRNREHLPRAKAEAGRAIELAPDLPEAHVALGRYYYQGYLDYENALEQFAIARRRHPNHVWTIKWTAVAQRRMGKFEEALDNLFRAAELDPVDPLYSYRIATILVYLRRYEEAEGYFEQAIGMAPDRLVSYCDKAWLYLAWKGDTKQARKVVDEARLYIKESASNKHIIYVLFTADLYDREYEKALEKLIRQSQGFVNMARFIPNSLWLAEVYGYMGEKDLEKQYFQGAAAILKKKVAEDPNDHRYHSSLGKAYAGLGLEQEAVREGLLGVECLPVTTDAYLGPLRLEDLARIYVMVGKYDEAIEKLEYLLSIPSEVSKHYLRLYPAWDPLRNHTDFKKLVDVEK